MSDAVSDAVSDAICTCNDEVRSKAMIQDGALSGSCSKTRGDGQTHLE